MIAFSRAADGDDWSVYDVSERLRVFGWIVPAYPMPTGMEDVHVLRKFMSDRGKIRTRRVSGNCVQHQRDVAIAVKNAREVALLPFSSSTR